MVGRIQTKVASRLRRDPDSIDDRQVGDGLAEFLRARGLPERHIARDVALVSGPPPISTPTILADSSDESGEDVVLCPAQSDKNEDVPEQNGYWVSHSARQGFRRLHRFGGCWIQPSAKDTILQHLEEIVYDMRCKFCYPEDRVNRNEPTASSSSSSSVGDSSSD